jgi:hypothetical protein
MAKTHIVLSALLVGGLLNFPAFGKTSMHCHKPDGAKMVDLPDAKDEAACKAASGLWAAHEPHCHVKDGEQWIDSAEHKTKKACTAAKGEWQTDHPMPK